MERPEGLREKQFQVPQGGDNPTAREERVSDGADSLTSVLLPSRDTRARRPLLFKRFLAAKVLRQLCRLAALMLLDVLAILLALWTALETRLVLNGDWSLTVPWEFMREVAPLVCLVTLLLFARSGLYAERPTRPGLAAILAILLQVTVVSLIYSLIEGRSFSSYYIFFGSFGFAVLYVRLFRAAYDRVAHLLLAWAMGGARILLVGSGRHVDATAERLAHRVPARGMEPRVIRAESIGVDDLEQLDQRSGPIRSVVVADPDAMPVDPLAFAELCHERGIRFRIAASTIAALPGRLQFTGDHELPMFEVKAPLLDGLDFHVKRAFDVAAASLLTLLLLPVMALITLTIKSSSPGALLYRSIRPGVGGKPFPCFKFRTMCADAEGLLDHLEDRNEKDGALFKLERDPRVTTVGRFLRRSSLDELPQLINVLRGDMSLVGPRPLPNRDFGLLSAHHKRRYHVLPGITGLWQVSGRSDLDFEEMAALDLLYIENWSVWLDLSILLRTIPAVLRARGAY